MIIKSSSLHWGLIFPQGVLRSWTENVLQKKNNFCPAKQICPAAKRCNSSDFSTTSWPTKMARIDARGKNVVLAHIKKQHILSQSGYVAPAELKFPWIISLCLGIQPPASPRLNVLLKFDGKISLGVLVMSCALLLVYMQSKFTLQARCFDVIFESSWRLTGFLEFGVKLERLKQGHRYFLIYFSILCMM